MSKFTSTCICVAVVLTLISGSAPLRAQVGKSQGVVDANTTAEKDLAPPT